MAEPRIDLEEVVREVLARLGCRPQTGAHARQTSGEGGTPSQPRPPSGLRRQPVGAASGPTGGQLAVSSAVVTMAELEGRLDGVRELVVSPLAVLTPSVRDEIRRRNVALVYDQRAAARAPGAVRLVMIVPGSGFDPAPLTRALQTEGIEVQMHTADCLIAAADRLSAELAKPNTLGLMVTADAAVALCLANRHPGVRAVLGFDAGTVAADAASVGANLLVVNPKTLGFFPLKQTVARFCGEGPRECPEALRERLG